ncbi:MAG: 30S ribosome-binding factor RbfA [Planctomycetes bacterium]|nr:30S ribosome-binding factor RbfA [Planctomycetota bacterium]
MTLHHQQVTSVIQRAVQTIISRGLNDPRIRGMISITQVRLSPDFAQATLFVSILPIEHESLTFHGLSHAAPHIRYQLSRAVSLRRVPRIEFRLDKSIKKQNQVLSAIARARRSDLGDESHPEIEIETINESEVSRT